MYKMISGVRAIGFFATLLVAGLLLGGCPFQLPGGGQVAQGVGNVPPAIQFTEPSARVELLVGEPLTLRWIDDDPDDEAMIRLEYDLDGLPHTGDETMFGSASEDDETDTFVWDTTDVLPGVYRIGATIDDGVNPPVTVYLPWEVLIDANVPPDLTIFEPSADVTDPTTGQVTIRWSDHDPEENATINVFYDVDGAANSGDETFILRGRKEDPDGASDEFTWDLSAVPAGTYSIGATIDDGVNPAVTVYAMGRLILNGPSITVLQPAVDATYESGESLVIRWTDSDPSHSAQISLYYDVDLVPDNGNEELIAVVAEDPDTLGGDEYSWTIPTSQAQGAYYVLARLSNGVDADAFSYAPGAITVVFATAEEMVRDLAEIGTAFYGVIFEGYMPNARLGEVMAGGGDIDGDGFGDFVLVAPQALSPVTGTAVGEAYLIYSGPERWFSGQVLSVARIGSPDFYGTIFLGPLFTTASDGIREVLFIEDQDGDKLPEIVFGAPDINAIAKEEQDWDPQDDDTIDYLTADNEWLPDPSNTDPQSDDQDDNGFLRSGLIFFASSTLPLGNATIMLDELGQEPVTDAPGNGGLRIYPEAGNDTTRWGEHLGVADIDSDFWDDLFVSRPEDGAGSVRVISLSTMANWTDDLGALGLQAAPETYTWPAADIAGADRSIVWPMTWWDITGDTTDAPQGRLGHPAGLGDFNQDGHEDMTVSAPDGAPGGLNQAGIGYVIYGRLGGYLAGVDVGQFDDMAFPGFELEGTAAGDRLGYRNIGPGDLNQDGKADWVLSAPWRDWAGRQDAGAVVIVYGKQIYGSKTFDDVGTSSLQGAVIYGANADDRLGTWLVPAGDVDHDTVPDLLIAAPGYDVPDRDDCGVVYLVYGGPHLVGEIDIRDIGSPALPGKVYIGPEAGAGIGPVAGIGDIDLDRRDDFLIGYPGADASDMIDSGRVFLIYGSGRIDR